MRYFFPLLLVLGLASVPAYGQYCTPTYFTGTIFGDSLSSIQISNLIGNYPSAPTGYSNYTLLDTVNLSAGAPYTLTLVNNPSWTSGVSIWIDLNQNQQFEATERIFTTDGTVNPLLSGGATGIYTVTMPVTAIPGYTRMRVVQTFAFQPTDPCGTYTYGETEDYTVFFAPQSPNDVAVISLVNFDLTCQAFASGIPITAAIGNIGTNAASSFQVSYSINGGAPVTGTIPSLASSTVNNFTFATPAVFPLPNTFYTLKIWHNASPDGNVTNDTLTLTLLTPILGTLPFSENFETFTVGSPGILNNGWTKDGPSQFNGWYVNAGPTPNFGTGPNEDHTPGNGAIYMYTESFGFSGGDFNLYSPCINLAGANNPRLSFWYHMNGASMGTLEVYVIANGVSTLVWSLAGQQQPTEGSPWLQAIADLTAYAGQIVQVEFRGLEGPGFQSNMAIDDIQLFNPAPTDAGAVSILSPTVPGCYDKNETVVVRIQNLGTQTLNLATTPVTVNLGITGPIPQTFSKIVNSGTLPLLATLDVQVTLTADLSTAGTYTLTSWTALTGDPNAFNDTTIGSVVSLPVVATPLLETFETSTSGVPGVLANGWTRTSTNAQGWYVSSSPTPSFATGPNTDNTPVGVNFVFTEASGGNTGDVHRLISPCIDLDSLIAPKLKFFYHMAGTNMGTLVVDVISGTGTDSIWSISGPQQLNESDPWKSVTLNLSSYVGQTIQIVFRGIRGQSFDSDMAVDDINVFDPGPIDVLAGDIVSPIQSCGLSAAETVKVEVINFGTGTLTGITAAFSVDGGPLGAPQVIPGSILPGDTLVYTFTTTANLAAAGAHTIFVDLSIAGDGDITNDTTSVSLFNFGNAVNTYPYAQGFEGTSTGWTTGGTLSSWVLGTPAKATIQGAAGGTKAWVTGGLGTGTYNSQEQSFVIGPCFNFSSLLGPVFKMDIWWESEGFWDGAVLQSSIDGGVTWQRVGNAFEPVNWYNFAFLNSNPGGQSQGWAGRTESANGSGGWVSVEHDLTGLGGQPSVLLRIAFGADFSVQDDGIAFDNILIYERPPQDVNMVGLVAPTDGCNLTAASTVTVNYSNTGTQPFSTVALSYQVNNGTVVTQTANTNVLPGDTAAYTFTVPANLSATGIYSFNMWATLAGDTLSFNDTLQDLAVEHVITVNTFPYIQKFEQGQGGWISGGSLNSWAFGTPAKQTISGASSGVNAWVTGGLGQTTYNNQENSFVVGPCFDFGTLTNPAVQLDIWWESEFSWDGAVLQSSINGGQTWQNVGAFGDPNNWYTDNSVNGLPGGSQEAWSGAGGNGSGGWVTARHALTGLNGQASVRLRIAFGTDFSVVDDGFAFDNIIIYNQLATDFGSIAITDPFGSLCSSSATPVSVQVTNYGTQTQSNIPVTVLVSGAGAATLTGVVPGPLAPGDTATFAIGAFNSSAGGTFNFSTYTGLTGDVNLFNDSASASVAIALVPSAPIPGPDSICAVAPVSFTLTAFSATSEVRWYDAPTGGNLLEVGDTLVTPVLGTTTTYYAEAASPLSYGDFALEDNSVGFGFYDNFFSEGLGFDALQPFTLNSVRVFPSSSGSISVNLLSSTGTLLETAVFPFAGTVGDTVLTLNWDIDAGNDYVINAGGTSLQFFGGLFRNFFGISFPYTQPGIVTIDGSATGSTFDYYFFYDWQITALGCPSGRVPVAATFLALTDVDLGADGAYCSGFELDAFDPTIVSYEWNNNPAINTPSITPTQTGLYTVEVVNNFGCVSADTIALIINPAPTVSLGADQTACGSVTLNAGNAGALFSWSNGASSQSVTVSQSGIYSVVVTALGCTDADTVNVTILPAPVVELGINQTSCLPVTLNAGAGATSYLWSTGATTQTISVTPPSSGSTTVSVTVTGANGCTSTDQVTVNAGVSPVVNLGADVTACDSTLLVSGISGVTYLWNTGATTQNLYVFNSGAYSVTVTNAQGCTDKDTVNATINLTPDALATFQNNNFDFTVNFVNQSTPATGATYSWDFGDGSAPSSDVNPVHTYTEPGSFLVILTVSNACGTDKYEFLVGGVSIDNEAFGRSLSIYPNPTDGLFSLLGEDMHAENLSIQVTDARGRLVYERTEENVFGAYRHEMNLSEAAEGVYNVRISDGVNTTYKRVIRR